MALNLPLPNPNPCAPAKPTRGTTLVKARDKQAKRRTAEDKEMRKARKRDNGCRFPGCDCKKKNLRIDVCHEKHRAMGGNPKLDRTTTDQLISFCLVRHGQWDRGEFDVVPHDRAVGFNGTADFYRKDERGRLEVFATEKRIGVSVTRDGR